MIGFQPFSHTDYMIVGKTKFLIEGFYPIVSPTNLQIYFGATHFPNFGFHRIHNFLSVSILAKIRMDSQKIYLPAVTVITPHNSCD